MWDTIKRQGNEPTIGLRWVFKIKACGRYRDRLVALVYKQFLGIDYSEVYAPMVNEVTFRLIFLMKLLRNWYMVNIDIEEAFFNSNIDEVVYVEIQDGWSEIEKIDGTEIGRLNVAIYGLKQASISFYLKMITYLKSIELSKSSVYPCLILGQEIQIGLYVDDKLIVVIKDKIQWFKERITEKYNFKCN